MTKQDPASTYTTAKFMSEIWYTNELRGGILR
jgi:hypothetical protein